MFAIILRFVFVMHCTELENVRVIALERLLDYMKFTFMMKVTIHARLSTLSHISACVTVKCIRTVLRVLSVSQP